MLTGEELEARRELIAESPELQALVERLADRARTVLSRDPAIPAEKGLLSADGGFCPDDRTPLTFDPWSPTSHACPRCGKRLTGERHDRRWAWQQHLWLGERIAELAAVGLLTGDEEMLAWSAAKVTEYGERYLSYPNADNVLGPARLFFSTYLESVWLISYLAGAYMLREAGVLDEDGIRAADTVAEEASNLIGEFEEGLSNRQTWHNAALIAAAVWFEDEALAERAIEGRRGLVGHLVDGFGNDGMWYEGENYHLFALRGLLIGAAWARLAGVDFFEEEASQARLAAALRAPARSALPDGRFPARKDARFGISLAQPMYLELWERGIADLLSKEQQAPASEMGAWLRWLYALPAPAAEVFDSYLHEAGEEAPVRRNRSDLSWWMLLSMVPQLPGMGASWAPASTLLEEQGLALLRQGDRYISLECGEYGGGHGHPDRLHLTLHAGGVHWLADPGTGSYVSPELAWYRSTMAHNAPRVDETSQPMADARCEMFDAPGPWSWVRGKFGRFTRTVIAGPAHLVDVVEFADDQEHLVELPWHPEGQIEILSPGRWEPAALTDPFATGVEQFLPDSAGPIHWQSTVASSGRTLQGSFDGAGDLLRASGPGRPGEEGSRSFLVRRQRARYVRFAAVVAFEAPALTAARFAPAEIVVTTAAGEIVHRQTSEGWEVLDAGVTTPLRGLRRDMLAAAMSLSSVSSTLQKFVPPVVTAFHVADPPALDGTLKGFVPTSSLSLDHEDQYRRTEEPYGGPDEFSAEAWLAWDERALYVAVEVTKGDLTFRAPGAPPLHLDNEPELIHSDGMQLYLRRSEEPAHGWLIVPDPTGNGLQIRTVGGTAAIPTQAHGAWRTSARGYVVTVAITVPGWPPAMGEAPPRFDLVVNQMLPGRTRRLGQLCWSGGAGWAYLRGDRQDPAWYGSVTLA
ncbi:MAG: heparinase II/III family protein [Gemmatimonadota bacterium]